MGQRQYYINDPVFSEYVFYVINSATTEDKKKLNPYEIKKLYHAYNGPKRFADRESMERRLCLLTKLGVRWSVFLYKDDMHQEDIDAILEQTESMNYRDGKTRSDIIKSMKDKKMFVFGSADIMLTMHMAAQNSHSQLFVFDMRLKKLNEKLSKFKEENKEESVGDYISLWDSTRRMMLAAISIIDKAKSIVGIEPEEMKLLMQLMSYRNSFIGREKLQPGTYTGVKLANALKGLVNNEYIAQRTQQLKGIGKTVEYSILQKGIDIVFEFMKYVMRQSEEM